MLWGVSGTNYHAILLELAKLHRSMLWEFKKRLIWAKEMCRNPKLQMPSRMYPIETGCSFIAIPLPQSEGSKWKQHLEPLTALSKHDFRSPKAIGFTVSPDPTDPQWYLINWCFLEFAWEPDAKADDLLQSGNFFRETRGKSGQRYEFRPE